ncbi:MAG: MarR family transcriptional regulator [Spirochaetia bacterium]|nr:MarR family transcriptional regulator [Spirochaetia bacterium]
MKKSLNRKHVDNLIYNVLKVMYQFEQREAGRFGLIWSEVLVLKRLQETDSQRISDIAGCLNIPVFKASRLIKKLEKRELIEKSSGGSDKREVLISISDQGREIVDSIEDYNYKTIMDNASSFSLREIRGIMKAMDKLDKLLGVKSDCS